MQAWIENETATAKFPTMKAATVKGRKAKTGKIKPRESKARNERLTERYQTVLDSMSHKPSLKFPAGCNGRAEVDAAYRFLANEHVTFHSLLTSHHDATVARIRAQTVVLIPQDTTELDVTRPQEIMAGAGPLNDSARLGFHDHVNLALTPEHLALGVVAAKIWARDPVEFQKDADQKRAARRNKLIQEKESIRWVEGYRAACDVAQKAPSTLIVSLADSEGDVYEYLLEAQPVEGVCKASFIIRACQNRALVAPAQASTLESTDHLREQLAGTPVLAQRTIDVRARRPKSKDDRKRKQPREARTAVVEVRAARVTLRGPYRPGGKLPDLEVNAVLVSELSPPPDVEPIEWLLLTDLPIDTVEDVLRVVDYYMCRWQIEIYFRILKSGCKIEESQLETAARFEPYVALNMIVAWRIMYLMMLGRECPELPCDVVLDDDEWQAVYATVKKQPPPAQPPSIKTMVGLIASLGGWLGRKGDGEPGPKAMWVGMQRMTDLAMGWRARAHHSRDAPEDRPGTERRRE
jgi:Transposase Tn5 dimerisation domain/Transposase DNA-binding